MQLSYIIMISERNAIVFFVFVFTFIWIDYLVDMHLWITIKENNHFIGRKKRQPTSHCSRGILKNLEISNYSLLCQNLLDFIYFQSSSTPACTRTITIITFYIKLLIIFGRGRTTTNTKKILRDFDEASNRLTFTI